MTRVLSTLAQPTGAGAFVSLAKNLALAKGDPELASHIAARSGADHRVVDLLTKAAVGATGLSDPGFAAARTISTAFAASLRTQSVFYSLLEGGGLVRVPLRTRLSGLATDATAFTTAQGAAVPVSKASLSGQTIPVTKVAALCVLTNEALDDTGSAGETYLSRLLRRAAAATADAGFIDGITTGAPTAASAGTSVANALADLKALLAAVEPAAESRLMFAMAPDVARAASTLLGSGGNLVFPGMSPTGGQLLNVEAMATDALADGELILIDGAGIAGDSEAITIETSDQTSILMADNPSMTSDSPTSSTLVSMYQTNSTAFLARVYFGFVKFRANAVAVRTGVNWGGA